MTIAIISDTHDNIPNAKKAAEWIRKEKIKIIIHCGDIFKPETVKEILKIFKGKMYIVFSKPDADFSKIPEDSFKKLTNVKVFEEFGELNQGSKKIAFCHFPEVAKVLVESQKYDLVFYGHTHKPWIETLWRGRSNSEKSSDSKNSGQETKLVNPGNLANLFYKATFATYDTTKDKLELKIIDIL
jgi:hypothetical protein